MQNNMKYLGPCMLVPNMYPVNMECLIGSQRPEPGTVEQNKCMYRILDLTESLVVKLREREGQRVDLGRSLKGHL